MSHPETTSHEAQAFSREQMADRAEAVEDTYILLGVLLGQSPHKLTESYRSIQEDAGGDSAAEGSAETVETKTFVIDTAGNYYEIIETVKLGLQPALSLRYVLPITSQGVSSHVLNERIDFTRNGAERRDAKRKILFSPDRGVLKEEHIPMQQDELEQLQERLDPKRVQFPSAEEVAERKQALFKSPQKVAHNGLKRALKRIIR